MMYKPSNTRPTSGGVEDGEYGWMGGMGDHSRGGEMKS